MRSVLVVPCCTVPTWLVFYSHQFALELQDNCLSFTLSSQAAENLLWAQADTNRHAPNLLLVSYVQAPKGPVWQQLDRLCDRAPSVRPAAWLRYVRHMHSCSSSWLRHRSSYRCTSSTVDPGAMQCNAMCWHVTACWSSYGLCWRVMSVVNML